VNALDRQRKWHFVPLAEAGVEVEGGSFLGEVIESVNSGSQDHGTT